MDKNIVKEVEKKEGIIKITKNAVLEIAGLAALESYGIVKMVNPSFKSGVSQLLSKGNLKKGLQIRKNDDGDIEIDLYVIIESGINIVEVSKNLVDRVKHDIEKQASVTVSSVNVYVQGLKRRK